MNPIEINKRATFFIVEPLSLDGVMMQRIQEEFTGVLDLAPSYSKRYQLKFAQTGVDTSEEKSIEMKRADESLKITFDRNRIDVFSSEEYSLQEFTETIHTIKSVLDRLEINRYRRVAICHQTYFECTETQFDSCYSYVFREPVTSCVEWNAQRLLREPIIEGNALLLNDIIIIGRVLNANVNGRLINDKLLLNIDINTIPGSDIDQVNANINLFFNRAIELIERHERSICGIFTD